MQTCIPECYLENSQNNNIMPVVKHSLGVTVR